MYPGTELPHPPFASPSSQTRIWLLGQTRSRSIFDGALHAATMLVLLLGVFAPLLAAPLARLGIRINPGLASPATALMGAAVNGAVLAYLWQARQEPERAADEP